MDEPTGTRVQTWLKPKFVEELREIADADGRSVSGLIRVVLEEQLHPRGGGGATARGGGRRASSALAADAGADQKE